MEENTQKSLKEIYEKQNMLSKISLVVAIIALLKSFLFNKAIIETISVRIEKILLNKNCLIEYICCCLTYFSLNSFR